ncbi:MAG TPA: hypothetical protein VMV05_08415 [bacterium]|nr:hypothetical protein [bacterium]
MPDVNCITHSTRPAAGYCSKCQKPYCAICLDVEMGQPICQDCKAKKATGATPAASPPTAGSKPAGGGSPLNFKSKGLDDDPLGLFGATAPKPKVDVPPPPVSVPPPKLPMPSYPAPPKLDLDHFTPAAPKPSAPGPSAAPLSGVPAASTSTKPSFGLDSLGTGTGIPRPTLPKGLEGSAPSLGTPPPLGTAPPMSYPLGSLTGLPEVKRKNKTLNLVKTWAKYLIRRSYEMFDPVAQKLHVPTYIFLGIVFSLIGAAFIGVIAYLNRPAVSLVDIIPPIHIVQVNSGQISEMDVTTYTDLQNQLQTLGFQPLIQMTVPQIPSPNFFDVGMKEDIGTYSEILKLPGQITPHISFVTVFTNGVWVSTNGWQGDSHAMDYLISEFDPKDTAEQLYVKHVQEVEKLKNDKGWQVQSMNENRFMAALSDHLRWFLEKKDIQGWKADFALWH